MKFVLLKLQNEVDVCCVTKSWFKSDMPDEVFNIDMYGIPLRNDHVGRKGGGSFAYVRSNMVPNRLSELENPNLESFGLPSDFVVFPESLVYMCLELFTTNHIPTRTTPW